MFASPVRCPDCGWKLRGITGLDEVLNLRAHMAERHDVILATDEAAELRIEWEKRAAE